MSDSTLTSPFCHATLLMLAREIAADFHPLDKILTHYNMSADDWEKLKENPTFLRLLETEVIAWNAAMNTADRTKLKAAAMVEEWLPEAYRRIHDRTESLSAKTELAKLLARIGGADKSGMGVEGGSERVTVTINLGQDASLKFSKELPTRVIEAQPTET